MSADTPPRFDYLQRLPREIRDIIFDYMVQHILNYRGPTGLRIHAMRSHLITSPWVILNKQHCIEYLKVFLRNAEMIAHIPDPWEETRQDYNKNAPNPVVLENTMQLISHRFTIAASSTGTKAPRKALFPYIKGICFSYYYDSYSFFKIGFGYTDSARTPTEDCFVKPVKELWRYHEEYSIPSDKSSIEIWYGDPSDSIVVCLRTLDERHHSIVSLRSLHARIFVNDYDASVAVLDREVDVLQGSVAKIIEKMRVMFTKPDQLASILELKVGIERYMVRLRNEHLRVITETTSFWKARDDTYGLEDLFRIAESWSPETSHDSADVCQHQEGVSALKRRHKAVQTPMVLPKSDLLQKLPQEMRYMVFEYVIQETPDSEFLGQAYRNSKSYSVLKRHLLNAPCLALNKQYCAEYLAVLLGSLELGLGAQDPETLDHCLHIITLLFKIAGVEEKLHDHIRGICLYRHTHNCYRRRNGLTNVAEMHDENSSLSDHTSPLMSPSLFKQLYRIHSLYRIPANTISILLDYGNPFHVFARFDVYQSWELCWGFDFDAVAHTVQARIYITEPTASVLAIDRELARVREEVQKALALLREKNDFDIAQRSVEVNQQLLKLRKFHVENIEEAIQFWKTQDGWYGLEDMFRIAESWTVGVDD